MIILTAGVGEAILPVDVKPNIPYSIIKTDGIKNINPKIINITANIFFRFLYDTKLNVNKIIPIIARKIITKNIIP
jgi:hypothetical protein